MQKNYLGLVYPPLGHVGNTGDGVRMAQELGADLWHMNGVACTLGYCVPDYDAPLGFGMPAPGYIFVDQYCHRFMDETGTDTHQMGFIFSQFDTTSGTYPRMPAYVLFDEATRQAGPVGHTVQGRISDYYQWSPRNTAEIERGWIKTGKTVSELAEALALEPKALQETVARYNLACLGGHDADFNRRQDTLTPLIAPPFYGAAIWPCLINTEGGPRRNARAQVVSVRGEPIRRLYSAGELGSIWGMINPGAGNISECLAFGRIAGRNAAAEEPWE
ncbi:MAG: FAD-binding protein [Chloroflexi bacterium]|nr:FAD-binding protein [Chloroflexota bacterium]